MKNLIITLLLAFSTSAVFMGCEVPPSDPGSCMTEGDFRNSDVDKVYARTICEDWTYVLLENCVEVYGLPLAPTETDIALYCDQLVDDYVGNWGFVIDHSCNFLDNPSFECTQYSAAQAPLTSASKTERERFMRSIKAKGNVMNARKNLGITLQGARFSVDEYLGQ